MLNEGQLVSKSLLLLQGIPSSGVFELDQESFTFSLNANNRVYLTSRNGNAQEVKLAVNKSLLEDMMESGSYFLHLREFVECMSNPEGAEVDLTLQAFSLSVADFLNYY